MRRLDVCFPVAAVAWMLLSSADIWAAERPVVTQWDFGTEETTPLQSHGGVHRDVPGPRPPEYPDFETNNTAVKLDGQGAHLSVEDSGTQSPFDFTNGDAITLEAWVQVAEIRSGENVYVIGKGRTRNPGFAADNQNWALRVRETKGKCGVSFLFATLPASGAKKTDLHWHRWTTTSGFSPGKYWHHIAVSYRFGEPESIRAWIDGKPQTGVWDMGGETKEAPVVDDDAVWIGSSLGGSPGNSFRGSLDSIAVHRKALDDATMKTRFRRVGPEIEEKPELAKAEMPVYDELPAGRVLISYHEGMPSHDRWLYVGETLPAETMRFSSEAAVLNRLPQRFDDWGIRENWKAPVLMRIAADLQLPPGKHRLLMRVRGLSRLWANGEEIAKAKPLTGSPSGEEAMTPVPDPLHPGLRLPEHRQQEVIGDVTVSKDGKCRVVLETLVGGKAFRTDPGELCLAVESPSGKTFWVLPATGDRASPIELTDADVTVALARGEAALRAFDDQNRRAAAASQDSFWNQRHALAQQWAKQNVAPSVPKGHDHPIDAFLAVKVKQALADAENSKTEAAQQFHKTVLPILRDECFRCHGDKENGGLRLNTRAAALKGGDSEIPAVVPGDVKASELIRRIRSADPDERMPPGANPMKPEQIAVLEQWIKAGAIWSAPPISKEDVTAPPVVSDAAFLRRVYLDTVGVPPTESDIRNFLADKSPHKRLRVIDQLLDDERWADHWLSYWQDVLAENPSLLNSSLNTTGPFRWFLFDALRDNKPLDRLVTELMMLRGSLHEGGSAGFGIAAENDAPFAVKGQVIAAAFLGIELQCARCHDSPYHSTKQRDLYSLAAMFDRKPLTVPKTSRVPAAFFEHKMRESLIKVTLKPDQAIEPKWPFAEVTGSVDDESLAPLMRKPEDSRERLATLVTSPRNTRFAQVIVNRIWRRLMGAGFVEPVHDWEGHAASHPELLEWLAKEFVSHNFDVKYLVKQILTSQAYQREATGKNLIASPEVRFFVAPDRRRLSAEQIVDSLFAATGQSMDVEELTFDPDGRRPSNNRLTLGIPQRAWMFASLANERDRPSLSLPKARAIADILEAFGWTGSRQNSRTDRETAPNVLQPGALANSTASVWLTRAAMNSDLADTAVAAKSPSQLVDSIFLRFLGRFPSDAERAPLAEALADGFERRLVPAQEVNQPKPLPPLPKVTWSNHLRSEANALALEYEKRARLGPPADPRLRTDWREVFEDVVWSVANLRDFVWVP